MPRRSLVNILLGTVVLGTLAFAWGCTSQPPKAATKPVPVPPPVVVPPAPPPEKLPRVMLGIDVLEAEGFRAIAGKKIGLLTHPAGVNRRGESTVDVLRRAPGVRLVALFAPEHGFEGVVKAGENFSNTVDKRTGLPVYALYGQGLEKSKAMVKGLDALVIDLQDIGARSYTFNVIMSHAMEACFTNGVEVIVLDRPNPLGGLKVDGPPLDPENISGVGAYPRMPYVHGLTMGEIALMTKNGSSAISSLKLTDAVRAKGKLTVIPMRGWTRNMRWPETELKWVPTSPNVPSFEAAVGYAMVGLGTQNSPWEWGIGRDYHFRGIGFPKKTPDEIIRAMDAYKIPGLAFVKRAGLDREGKPITGVYVEVADWEKWHPTELSFYMHKQAALWSRLNPFAALTAEEQRSFRIHVGSTAWLTELRRAGGRIDVASFLRNWTERAAIYREQTKKFWLYPWDDPAPVIAPAKK